MAKQTAKKHDAIPLFQKPRTGTPVSAVSHADIAKRAESIYRNRKMDGGNQISDWLQAEKELHLQHQ